MRWLVRGPCRAQLGGQLAELLHVQRNGDSGSPRVTGSINRSRSRRRGAVGLPGSCLRPPPGRRIRPAAEGVPGSLIRPAPRDRPPRDARGGSDRGYPTPADGGRFCCGDQSPSSLVEERGEHLESSTDRGFIVHSSVSVTCQAQELLRLFCDSLIVTHLVGVTGVANLLSSKSSNLILIESPMRGTFICKILPGLGGVYSLYS